MVKTCSKNEYAIDTNILAISILLNRKIIIYNVALGKNCNRLIFAVNDDDTEHIRIGYIINHYFPILIKKENVLLNNVSDKDNNFVGKSAYFKIKLY